MFKKYLLNTSGNFSIMFSVCVGVLMLGAAAAIDISGAGSAKNSVQNYIDAAVLAAVTADTDDLQELQKIVDERIALLNTTGQSITANVRIVDETIVVDATTQYDTLLMDIFGKDNMNLSLSTGAPQLQSIPINLALVLDTTDSMEGANIDALEDAVEELLDDLETSGSDIHISIVPFGEYVNISFAAGETWLDVDADGQSSTEYNQPYQYRETLTSNTCTPTGNIIPGAPRYRDGVHIGYYDDVVEQSCSGATYGPYETRYRDKTTEWEWHGCAGSRAAPDNQRSEFDGVRIPGAMEIEVDGTTTQWARCGAEMIPLTNDFDALEDVIDDIATSGQTYMPSGLLWGWRTLDPSVPFTQAASRGADAVSAVVLMTDGANTRSKNGIYHNGGDGSAGLTEAANLCTEIKTDGIQIYTVAYQLPGSAGTTNTMLENCASNTTHSFSADNAAELKASFLAIGDNLKNVRLKY